MRSHDELHEVILQPLPTRIALKSKFARFQMNLITSLSSSRLENRGFCTLYKPSYTTEREDDVIKQQLLPAPEGYGDLRIALATNLCNKSSALGF